MSSITPNLLLVLPDVGVTFGPIWAQELNSAFELVDLHNHTENSGVKVPTAGLNINADLSFSGYSALTLAKVGLVTSGSDASVAHAVYAKNGDLYYTSTNLTAVQITDGTSIKGVAGNISGLGDGGSTAAFNDFTEDFTFKFNAGNKHAAFNLGDLRVFPFDGINAYANAITLKSPLALATAYSMTMPLSLPMLDNVLSITSTGVMQQGLGNGTVAAPSLAFASDTDTGIYRQSSNALAISTGGVATAFFDAGRLVIYGPGSSTVPTLVPANVGSTGIGGDSTSLYLISNSIAQAQISPAEFRVFSTNAVFEGSISGNAVTVGTLACTTLNTGSGGAIKFELLTGQISASGSGSIEITVAGGRRIVGLSGSTTDVSGNNPNLIGYTSASSTYFFGPGTSPSKMYIGYSFFGTVNYQVIAITKA